MPTEIISDCGSNFLSGFFRGLLKLIDCKALKTTPLFPSANGQAERSIRSVKNILRSYCYQAKSKWCNFLNCALFSYNVHQHSGVRDSPFRLVYGYLPRLPLLAIFDPEESKVTDEVTRALDAHEELIHYQQLAWECAENELAKYQLRAKTYVDNRTKISELEVGQIVMYNIAGRARIQKSLAQKFDGPYEIIQKLSADIYRLRSVDDPDEPTFIANRCKLKLIRDQERYRPSDI